MKKNKYLSISYLLLSIHERINYRSYYSHDEDFRITRSYNYKYYKDDEIDVSQPFYLIKEHSTRKKTYNYFAKF